VVVDGMDGRPLVLNGHLEICGERCLVVSDSPDCRDYLNLSSHPDLVLPKAGGETEHGIDGNNVP